MNIKYISVENSIAEWADKKRNSKKMGWFKSIYIEQMD